MIDHRRDDWNEAPGSGDVDAYADLMTEDIVWLQPHGDAIVGRQAFRSWLAPFLAEAHEADG